MDGSIDRLIDGLETNLSRKVSPKCEKVFYDDISTREVLPNLMKEIV